MTTLPIDPLLGDLAKTLKAAGAIVLEAPPGAGKTTRVPVALLDAGLGDAGEILVSEPRRLAARLVARFVATERGEKPGATVGYSVRFEDVSGPETRVRYLTEGVLVRRLLDDPTLAGVSVVVIDEVHERTLNTDLALALIHRLRSERRPDLRLCVMSATLDAEPIARFLGDCPRLRSEGRVFPLTIEHLEKPDDRPLEKQIASAVRKLFSEDLGGDVLVFLPGASEIRRAKDALGDLSQTLGFEITPLHGDLSLEEQARAVAPGRTRKVVLSTNIAETSITIEGITAVVDSGLARIASHSPWSGLGRLEIAKISRAAATQRAGRAGRTRPGRVLRLYTKGDFDLRPEFETPEIRRSDLSEALLTLHGAGIAAIRELEFLDPPPKAAAEAAETLLSMLGALEPNGALSAIGRRLLAFPLHPRLARVIVEAERRGIAERGALAAALLSERDLRTAARTSFGDRGRGIDARGDSDVVELIDRFDEAKDARFDPRRLSHMSIDARAARAADRAFVQLRRIARNRGDPPVSIDEEETRIRLALLTGYPDRVARRSRRGERELVLSAGGRARLGESSVVHDAELLCAVDVEERGIGKSGQVTVRLASAIEAEWLLELFPDRVTDTSELVWNATSERVERLERLMYGSVVLDESRKSADPSPEAARLLARAALASGAGALAAEGGLDSLLARIQIGRDKLPEAGFPDLGEDAAKGAIERAAEHATSLAELRATPLADAVLAGLGPDLQRVLRTELPERIELPGGRSLVVHYEAGRPPWVESRLQDFFGMSKTPSLCRGRLPLTLHLLAPNQRAVQVTSDLEGFWDRHYPSIRKELMRRYPRHSWPEDGRNAAPPPPRRPR